jgi:hypothetical protein
MLFLSADHGRLRRGMGRAASGRMTQDGRSSDNPVDVVGRDAGSKKMCKGDPNGRQHQAGLQGL